MKNHELNWPQSGTGHRRKSPRFRPSAKREVAGWLRLFVIVLLFPWLPAQAQSLSGYPEIEYASPDQSVWTTRLNDKGEPANPLFAYAETLFARAGLRWHGKTFPAARLFKQLQEGGSQFSILVRAPALEQCCLFSRKPVAVAEIRAYFIGDKAPVRAREELAGKSVITVHGYSYGGLLGYIADDRNRIANNPAHTHQAAFTMLERGRADYLVDYAGPAADVLAAAPMAGLRSELLARQEVYLVLAKSYPDAGKVMARLEAIAEALDSEPARK